MPSGIAWTLALKLYVMNVEAGEEKTLSSQLVEIKGFSSQADCEKAGEAAGEVFMLREGPRNGLMIDCKKAD